LKCRHGDENPVARHEAHYDKGKTIDYGSDHEDGLSANGVAERAYDWTFGETENGIYGKRCRRIKRGLTQFAFKKKQECQITKNYNRANVQLTAL
jgi:hypothetical protein